jgi:hypothetical protein
MNLALMASSKSMALALIASSNQKLRPFSQVPIYGSRPYGRIKAMALALMARSNLWF